MGSCGGRPLPKPGQSEKQKQVFEEETSGSHLFSKVLIDDFSGRSFDGCGETNRGQNDWAMINDRSGSEIKKLQHPRWELLALKMHEVS